MINFRRVLVSLVCGSLLLVAVGAQASAVESDAAALATAQRGLALGLQAADDLVTDAEDGIVAGEGVAQALAALEGIMDRFENRANRGNGHGPVRAIEVHEALLRGDLPGSVDGDDSIPGLAKAYGHMRAQLQGEGRGSGAAPSTTPAPATP
jgi:hypothetical protein